MRGRALRRACAAVVAACLPLNVALGSDTWKGSAGLDWGNGSNWSTGVPPTTTDTVFFNDTGASPLPGDVTSLLNGDRTVGGLSFSDSSGHYHTLDLGGHVLTLGGSLSFNVDQGPTTTTIQDGSLALTSPFAEINVGRAVSGGANATVDLSGVSNLNVTIKDVQVGTSTAGGASGTLTLGNSNSISGQLFEVGATSSSDSGTNGTVHLGTVNNLLVNQLVISQNFANALVDSPSGGVLNLGSAASRTSIFIANSNINTNNTYSGKLDLTGTALNAYLGDVIVGQRDGGAAGSTIGALVGAQGGSVNIGAAGNTGNFYVGHMLNGGASATGNVDFSGVSTLTANLNTLSIGTALSGSSQGTVRLAANNTISASSIIVGSSGNGSNVLTLGNTNSILTNQLVFRQSSIDG